jgi:hemin uptake protein HemP
MKMSAEAEHVASSAETPNQERRNPGRKRVNSWDLFRGARDLIIVHNGEDYRLRITRLGKLILTK